MQNLTEGQSVALDGKVATVIEVYPSTVKLVLEDGTTVVTHKANVSPRTLLNEGQ